VFFDDVGGVWRILVVGTLAYAGLVLLLRTSGKRTLSKMTAFDFVVTVALGSTLATVLLSDSVPLVEGLVALALLIGLQLVVAWLSVRSPLVRRGVKAESRLLVHDGRLLEGALRAERVTRDEVLQAIRSEGGASLGDVAAVVLETDGTMSVIHGARGAGTALRTVVGAAGPAAR
jgi:uncharacterized membrane protein YcaP (DUF421 family)